MLLFAKESGIFVDTAKMHAINHIGEFFSVKGPLNIARPRKAIPFWFNLAHPMLESHSLRSSPKSCSLPNLIYKTANDTTKT